MDLASYKVWVRPGLAYYPVRKSASSSLQAAFGGRPVDMRQVPKKGVLSFAMVRNPFDRLASLFSTNLDYYPLTEHGIHPGMSFSEFIDKVCEVIPPTSDQHLWPADHTTPAKCHVYYFEDLVNEISRLNLQLSLNLQLQHYGKAKRPKPTYTSSQQQQIAEHYAEDLWRFYENNPTQEGCRAVGKATAKIRQEGARRVAELDPVRHRPTPTHRSTKR